MIIFCVNIIKKMIAIHLYIIFVLIIMDQRDLAGLSHGAALAADRIVRHMNEQEWRCINNQENNENNIYEIIENVLTMIMMMMY